mmetsp:Transcript_14612/g.50802  ORF Transcript_14612/g.50802 Transcript_14612/m.50802 type:complete len:241 (+) Transcript_14612:1080-1802(+)
MRPRALCRRRPAPPLIEHSDGGRVRYVLRSVFDCSLRVAQASSNWEMMSATTASTSTPRPGEADAAWRSRTSLQPASPRSETKPMSVSVAISTAKGRPVASPRGAAGDPRVSAPATSSAPATASATSSHRSSDPRAERASSHAPAAAAGAASAHAARGGSGGWAAASAPGSASGSSNAVASGSVNEGRRCDAISAPSASAQCVSSLSSRLLRRMASAQCISSSARRWASSSRSRGRSSAV